MTSVEIPHTSPVIIESFVVKINGIKDPAQRAFTAAYMGVDLKCIMHPTWFTAEEKTSIRKRAWELGSYATENARRDPSSVKPFHYSNFGLGEYSLYDKNTRLEERVSEMSEEELRHFLRDYPNSQEDVDRDGGEHRLILDMTITATGKRLQSDFSERVKKAVTEELNSFTPSQETTQYGYYLTGLVDSLSIQGARPALIALFRDDHTEGLIYTDSWNTKQDFRSMILKGLASSTIVGNLEKSEVDFWEGLFEDPKHFDIAFVALAHGDFRKGVYLLGSAMDKAETANTPASVVDFGLEYNLIRAHLYDEDKNPTQEMFKRLRDAIAALPENHRKRMRKIVLDNGFSELLA